MTTWEIFYQYISLINIRYSLVIIFLVLGWINFWAHAKDNRFEVAAIYFLGLSILISEGLR